MDSVIVAARNGGLPKSLAAIAASLIKENQNEKSDAEHVRNRALRKRLQTADITIARSQNHQ
jgi:hypothetical protein